MKAPGHRAGVATVLAGLLLAAPLAAVGVFHVWSRTRVQGAGYELGRLEAEHRQLLADRDRLNLEVGTLRSPGRLERFARERLGMAPPAPGAVVAGTVGGKVGLSGGVGDGADQRPGPAEPDVKTTKRREARTGPRTGAPDAARP
jgi:cell division protein FtsL